MLKKALLVGINDYPGNRLKGCVNDVMQMKEVLTDLFEFESDNIRIILNQEATKQGIIQGLKWLAEGGSEPAVRVFHYAGHGHSVPDKSGDERDGSDEALVPYDYLSKRFLIDDELKSLYQLFPSNSNLTLIMDCCHSGTIQRDPKRDRKFRFIPNTYPEREAIARARRKFKQAQRQYVLQAVANLRGQRITAEEFQHRVAEALMKYEKQPFGGDYQLREGNVLFAACQSDQQASDANIRGSYHGAFTYYLIKALRESNGRITHHDLVKNVGEALKTYDYQQVPQLECDPGREKAKIFSFF
ncbi:MAG: caspase family protein [candidate division KSB1 bacterium]|nr:caspase family protein [candidate division KSB1 bacterium]MDZ7302390.1 caspase family protein [candidate division KSB1 bacterium]MDZ7311593.1 caspase family protein [candidate division KSB1 bacterium]